jgi:hypothetical protein
VIWRSWSGPPSANAEDLSVTNRIELLLYFATCLSDSGSTKASKGLNLPLPCSVMKDLLILLTRLLTTIAKPPEPSGAKTLIADSLLMKQQLLLILSRQGHAVRLIAAIPFR